MGVDSIPKPVHRLTTTTEERCRLRSGNSIPRSQMSAGEARGRAGYAQKMAAASGEG